MLLSEWKDKHSRTKHSQYTHFDKRISLDTCFQYITTPEKVARHSFYPFIHYTIKQRKAKNGKASAPKLRQIYYAAHIDDWIYRYYTYLFNEKYNQKLQEAGLDSVVVAYRTNSPKNNVDLAKEAFDHIKSTDSCHVMIGDFTDFFDNLNHAYLKKQLCWLLSTDKLPDDVYQVYKNITRFSYVELKDLLELNQLQDNLPNRRLFNNRSYERALSLEEFKKNKHIIHKAPHRDYGIPQGCPICTVLANLYMFQTDKKIQEYVAPLGGFYMRYSDDFIIVIPRSNTDFSHHYQVIKSILDEAPQLELKSSKTKIFLYDNKSIQNQTELFTGNTDKLPNIVEFLGFAFDGEHVRIRDKTISKYYCRMYRKLRTIVNSLGETKKHHLINNRNVYLKYSYRGSKAFLTNKAQRAGVPLEQNDIKRNFLDYVYVSQKKFGDDFADKVTANHMQKIRKQLRKVQESRAEIKRLSLMFRELLGFND